MTKEEAESNLGVIAKSGSYTFKNGLGDDKAEDLSIIGQFGVGFYSAFMVSDEVTVITRHYGEETATKWQSSGADGYTVSEDSREAAGTDVIMHLKPDTEDEEYSSYLEVWKIKSLIKKYSDYVRWPIKMDPGKTSSTTAPPSSSTIFSWRPCSLNHWTMLSAPEPLISSLPEKARKTSSSG